MVIDQEKSCVEIEVEGRPWESFGKLGGLAKRALAQFASPRARHIHTSVLPDFDQIPASVHTCPNVSTP
jgi:hypothetical protein